MAQPGQVAGIPNASGSVSIPIAPNISGLKWRLYQVTVSVGAVSDPVTPFAVYLALNGIPITSRCVGMSPLTADGPPPLDVGSHETLTAEVSGVSPLISQNVALSYQYDELTA